MNTAAKPGAAKGKLFAVAPMMDWTDRHCRVFHRTLTARALLYTEMVTDTWDFGSNSRHSSGSEAATCPFMENKLTCNR